MEAGTLDFRPKASQRLVPGAPPPRQTFNADGPWVLAASDARDA